MNCARSTHLTVTQRPFSPLSFPARRKRQGRRRPVPKHPPHSRRFTKKHPYLHTGKIVSTHGVHGEVKLLPWADGPEFLLQFHTLYLDGKAYQVEQSRVQKTCVLLKLEGVDTVEAASALRDKVVSIARADAKLPEGSLFIADLLGLPVYDGETLLGTLAEVMPTPANDVYVVKSEDGQEHLIPSVPDFVLERNLDEGYIRVRLIEGM